MPGPEVRIDQLTGLRTVLAPGRAERPEAFAPAAATPRPDAAETCPFCEHREDRTPPEVWAERPGGGEAEGPGWIARAVPNLHPVVGEAPPGQGDNGDSRRRSSSVNDADATRPSAPETGLASSIDPLRASTRGAEPDLFASTPASGAHEVVVSAPEHVTTLAALPKGRLTSAIAAWRQRMAAHAGAAAYVHLIVNEGPDAGASLEHSHAQLYALGFVPAEIARERERAAAYHERTTGGHLLEDVATEEVRRRERLVAIDDEAMLVCPWASRAPFELRIIPRSPAPSFERDDRGAAMIAAALRALGGVFDPAPQLNLWVRTAPRGGEEFCWHVDLVPRLTIRAGFELGTGTEVNVYAPERAAADLRAVLGE